MKKKVCLVIIDGWGEAPKGPGNAITLGKTPNFDELKAQCPHGLLQASGEAVGVVKGVMGSSEIGHFTIGAGRIVPQYLLDINRDIKSGEFFKKKPLIQALNYVKKNNKKLHLLGMISDKGVHAHIDHILTLLEWATREGIKKVYLHCITDGRDVPPQSAKKYIKQVQNKIAELGNGSIATVIGRYYSMDRDHNWDRIQKGYRLMTLGEGEVFADPLKGIDHFYAKTPEANDQYMKPVLVDKNGLIETGDSVIYVNFRTDRPRQMTSAFVDPDFTAFERTIGAVKFVCMGPYSKNAPVVYGIPKVENNLGVWLSKHKIKQLRIAETEKYAHLTYFFNSQVEHAEPLEDRIHIPTPHVKTHDEKPALASAKITKATVNAMKKGDHSVIIINFANGDLVGHTGILSATIKAVESIDIALGKLRNSAKKNGYILLITADHGNVEDMLLKDGSPKSSHSLNPVIFLVYDPDGQIKKVHNGGLADVAPTLLKIIGLRPPLQMTGKSLI